MFRTKEDFLQEWSSEKELTMNVLHSLTDETLGQSVVAGHSTLGWLGWHVTTTIPFFASAAGLKKVERPSSNASTHAKGIVEAYDKLSSDLLNEIKDEWTDEDFSEMVDFFGSSNPKGYVLRMLLSHQGHHRGQMTVLLRQAGLPVPGVYGPTIEDKQK
ncbi:DinB family protein [Alkalicoccobacillus murimartini]|uniref:Damage-inducible protein DinB n=1 Tax=Alkalicoccobacillus murimartini TaxID=171685 RepID=A0ABT9YLT8_9BACI|nr:DinB family protein [Alkalicoccobacillus murimartini]MDQ0207974.1 putative damage-inducible protein DinB [Alkalicoccobacillus murimartini]